MEHHSGSYGNPPPWAAPEGMPGRGNHRAPPSLELSLEPVQIDCHDSGQCPRWSQVVAAALGVPANVVAVWSQSGRLRAVSDPSIGPLTSGFGGAPRGIRTPNRQIRSQPSSVPARPPAPFGSQLLLVNGCAEGRIGHLSPPVTRAMVAIWSQCRAIVARQSVW
jgi:hypothetical protein